MLCFFTSNDSGSVLVKVQVAHVVAGFVSGLVVVVVIVVAHVVDGFCLVQWYWSCMLLLGLLWLCMLLLCLL